MKIKKIIAVLVIYLTCFSISFAEITISKENLIDDFYQKEITNSTLIEDNSAETEALQGNVVEEKNITQTFSTTDKTEVIVTSKYGNIKIIAWNKNEVKIEALIKASGTNVAEVKKQVEKTNFTAKEEGDIIHIITSYATNTSKKRESLVDFVIYLPKKTPLTLSHQYGNVFIENLESPLLAKVYYGNLTAKSLLNNNNEIAVKYGKTVLGTVKGLVLKQEYGAGIQIESVEDLNLISQYVNVNILDVKNLAQIKHQYGNGFYIGNIKNLELSSQYSKIDIQNIKNSAKITAQYGNGITIGTVKDLELQAQYLNVQVNSLFGDADFQTAYAKLNISQITKSVQNLNINSSYTVQNLAFAKEFQGKIEGQTSNSRLNSSFNIEEKKTGSINYLSGTIGSAGTAKIYIKANYGSINVK